MQNRGVQDMSIQRNAPKPHWWQRKESIISFAIIGTLVLLALLILAVHIYHLDLTTTTSTEVTQSPKQKVTTSETGKSLLDWLQLVGVIAIPIVVAVGTAVFATRQTQISEANRKQQNDISEANRNQQHDTDVQIAETQQQEELLRTYFDKISELLLDKKLNTNPNIQSIVRARTLAALHMLNTERKAIVLRFLHDADLLQYVKSFLYELDLSNTDLNSINLSGANLHETNLSNAKLNGANLSGAELMSANLSNISMNGADLTEAILSNATATGAVLTFANLSKANLTRTNLTGAYLSGAILCGADLNFSDLSKARLFGTNLSGAHLQAVDLGGADLSGADLFHADLRGANLDGANLNKASLREANLDGANLYGTNYSKEELDIFEFLLNKAISHGVHLNIINHGETNLVGADLSGASLSGTHITQKQLEDAKNITIEQLAQIKPLEPAAPQAATTEQPFTTLSQSETKPDQTSQEEAEQQGHTPPKQDIDAAH